MLNTNPPNPTEAEMLHRTETESVADKALEELRKHFAASIRPGGHDRYRIEVAIGDLTYWDAIATWGLGEGPHPAAKPDEIAKFDDVIRRAALPLSLAGLEAGLARVKQTARRLADGETTLEALAHEMRLMLELSLIARFRLIDADLIESTADLDKAAEAAFGTLCHFLDEANRE